MCGIAGIVGLDRREPVEAAEIERMCEAIVHRGPDDEGMYLAGGVGMGMRRLSIIDLVGGRQPVHNEDETIWVVFNGEIYNFVELRQDLQRRGHQFSTSSDTEVIPHLYEEYGKAFVTRLRGMFAIAIYDERRRTLVLARDRLGKKPLFYGRAGGRLLFGSEIRSLLAAAPELADVDPESLLYVFQFGYVPDPRSVFRGIRRLPPAHTLEFRDGEPKLSQYWEMPAYDEHSSLAEDEWLDALERELRTAVRLRLISDVPLGALLSGGVDSSVVVALMAQEQAAPVKTFSIAFSKQDFNEGPYAAAVARQFGTDHHELVVQPEIGGTLDNLTRLLEEPFFDSSILPTYYISRLVREHVTVALSGDGGDELFAGYDRYAVNVRREAFRFIPRWVGRSYRHALYPHLPAWLPGRRFLYNVILPFDDRYIDSVSLLAPKDRDSSLFTTDFLAATASANDPRQLFHDYMAQAPTSQPLCRMQFLDTKTYLPADVLTKVDRMSMAASLEVRCPILDHLVVELAARVPVTLKRREGESKYLLKKLASRLGVPREVLYRPKMGFAVPLVHWLRHELKDEILAILSEPRTIERGYFNRASVQKLVREHLRRRRDRSHEIWLLLMFELWHRNFLESWRGQKTNFSAVRRTQAAPNVVDRRHVSATPA